MVRSPSQAHLRACGVGALVAMTSLIAACGSGSSSHGSTSAGGASASTRSSASAVPAEIGTATGPDGTYLTGSSGRAVYQWVGDSDRKSNCSQDCAAAWPPVITTAAPIPAGRVVASELGTITRPDGSTQVTYNGHPLYYFVLDAGPGTTKGQGSDSFGARWWLVAPSGAPVTAGGSSSVSPPTGY
jgi:predicted lipoprotein with Yx(FWY)xxD motif